VNTPYLASPVNGGGMDSFPPAGKAGVGANRLTRRFALPKEKCSDWQLMNCWFVMLNEVKHL